MKPLKAAAIGLMLSLLGAIGPNAGPPVRIKDLTDVEGVRSNPLVGYGLVVGLNGTGDSDDAHFSIFQHRV